MKKLISIFISVFIISTAWADNCTLTDHTLSQGGNPTYDDYLYQNSRDFEVRAEGKSGLAFLCGTGYCSVGTKIRLREASAGGSQTNADAVYECINKDPTSARTSYQWKVHMISPSCAVNTSNSATKVREADVKNAGQSLYLVNGGYCSAVVQQGPTTTNVTVIQNTNVSVDQTSNLWDAVKTFFDDRKEIRIARINGQLELSKTYMQQRTMRIAIRANSTVEIATGIGRTITTTWQTTTDGVVKIVDTTGRVFLGGMKIMADGTVAIINSLNQTVQTIAKSATEAYKATLEFFGGAINSFNATIQQIIRSSAQAVGIAIQEVGATIRTAMDDATDFAKHFVTEIVGGVRALKMRFQDRSKLQELELQISQCATQEQVSIIVEQALRNAELSDAQCNQVRNMINAYAVQNNKRLNVIENRIGGLEEELRLVKQQNIEMSYKIEGLGSQYNSLAAQVRTKVNAKQVITLINEYTSQFSEGQKQQLYAILAEYTKQLSEGQRAEVQDMIAAYVDPRVTYLNVKIENEAARREAENKVLSAMSVLNSFASSAKVSVWKTADGKFNGARLASDSIAGAVLGTAGGLITHSVIKKNQTEKGFEDIKCTVNGEVVGGYGDEFVVGM
mgnify:CR=1 FL=1